MIFVFLCLTYFTQYGNLWVHPVQFSLVAQSCLTLCNPTDCSRPGLPVHHQLPDFIQKCPLNQWCHPTISSSVIPFSSCLQFSQHQGLFKWVSFASGAQSTGVSISTSVLPMNTQDWSPCSPRDSQESSPTPQFKSINSSVLSFLYSPTLTSIHDYWKNHSFD